MSPRRSSRARTTQAPLGVATAHSTSSSSVSSARTERAFRIGNKQPSPQKLSLTPRTLSPDEHDDPSRGSHAAPPLTRRRTREQDHDKDQFHKLDGEVDDDLAEEDEVTRCVCGYQEYPGSPSDTGKSNSALAGPATQGDDPGGMFIQCDICKVWQHGGCVGIMNEAASPDEYFCEECRKDLHKLLTTIKGQKYSRYLPVCELQNGKNRKMSMFKETEKQPSREKERHGRTGVDSFGKRRSTMNSRAAYDEDEVLKKVLEESKYDGAPVSENHDRKKRSREASEEVNKSWDRVSDSKRPRTGSPSPRTSPVIESEDDSMKLSAPKQRPRGAAARSQREKELRDQEREKERAEAASRRKGRAERRKGEDIEDHMEPTPTPADDEPMPPASVSEAGPLETPAADTRPASAPRRGGRPPQKSRGRLGRNQYSRDTMPASSGDSPLNDSVQSSQVSGANGVANGSESSDGTSGSKAAKSKNSRLQKLSWNEIKRSAGIMQSYIAQRQVEMASEKHCVVPIVQSATTATNEPRAQQESKEEDAQADLAKFRTLSTTQMMDFLSRDLMHWQQMISQPLGK